jgi:hypothetical protein
MKRILIFPGQVDQARTWMRFQGVRDERVIVAVEPQDVLGLSAADIETVVLIGQYWENKAWRPEMWPGVLVKRVDV